MALSLDATLLRSVESAEECWKYAITAMYIILTLFAYSNNFPSYRTNTIPQERFEALENLGFEWSRKGAPRPKLSTAGSIVIDSAPPTRKSNSGGKSNDEIWRERFEELKQFKAENGHANGEFSCIAPVAADYITLPIHNSHIRFNCHDAVPGTYHANPVLGRWVCTQRTTYRRNQMAKVS